MMKNGKFGLELEMAHIEREKAARIVAEIINGRVEYLGTYYQKWAAIGPDGRQWVMMTDASIIGEGVYGGCEFVTPLCGFDDIETVQEMVRALRKAGAHVNDSCGIHIHIDCEGGWTAKGIKNLTNMMAMRETMIFKALGTRACRVDRWCKKVNNRFVGSINDGKKRDLDKIRDIWYDSHYECRTGYRDHYNNSRYHALNLHSLWQGKGVEFRMFEATLHAGEIKADIQFALALADRAATMRSASWSQVSLKNDVHSWEDWLYRIGLVGDEFAVARYHLMKRIDGRTWKDNGQAAA